MQTKEMSSIFHMYQNVTSYNSGYLKSLYLQLCFKTCDMAFLLFIVWYKPKKDDFITLFDDVKYKDIIDMRS